MRKFGWILLPVAVVLFSLVIFLWWQREELKKAVPAAPAAGAAMRSELFLQKSPAPLPKEPKGPPPPPAWKDFKIPARLTKMERYSAAVLRAKGLLVRRVDQPSGAAPQREELENAFVQEIVTVDGLAVQQMFDKQSGEIVSERWQDQELGTVIRYFHPEERSLSLKTESSKLRITLVPSPRERAEYLTVAEKGRGLVSIREEARETFYFADLAENRFIEYRDGGARQWQRVGENLFQEIDETGQRLSLYKVDPVSREIVPAN